MRVLERKKIYKCSRYLGGSCGGINAMGNGGGNEVDENDVGGCDVDDAVLVVASSCAAAGIENEWAALNNECVILAHLNSLGLGESAPIFLNVCSL
jgi:hypothetical protein